MAGNVRIHIHALRTSAASSRGDLLLLLLEMPPRRPPRPSMALICHLFSAAARAFWRARWGGRS